MQLKSLSSIQFPANSRSAPPSHRTSKRVRTRSRGEAVAAMSWRSRLHDFQALGEQARDFAWSNKTEVGLVLFGAWALWRLIRFCSADCNLTLLGKGRPPRYAFKDKVVWVVGASQGLGQEIALRFAQLGARIILSSRNESQLQAVREQCELETGLGNVVVLPLDVLEPYAELARKAERADAAFPCGGVDLLVLSAGASQHAAVEELEAGAAARILDLNLRGPAALTRAALPFLLSRGGARIVALSSMAAVCPAPGQAMYAGSKVGLHGYLLTLQSELSSRGVEVTIACPGPVATGAPGQPRNIFGPSGLVTKHEEYASARRKRMDPARVADLIVRAAYHKLDLVWIARHPVLLLGYSMQYLPALGRSIMRSVGPARVASIKAGGSGYDAGALLGRSSWAKPPAGPSTPPAGSGAAPPAAAAPGDPTTRRRPPAQPQT